MVEFDYLVNTPLNDRRNRVPNPDLLSYVLQNNVSNVAPNYEDFSVLPGVEQAGASLDDAGGIPVVYDNLLPAANTVGPAIPPSGTVAPIQQLVQGAQAQANVAPPPQADDWSTRISNFVRSPAFAALQRAAILMSAFNNPNYAKISQDLWEHDTKQVAAARQAAALRNALRSRGVSEIDIDAAMSNPEYMKNIMSGIDRGRGFAEGERTPDNERYWTTEGGLGRLVPVPGSKAFNEKTQDITREIATVNETSSLVNSLMPEIDQMIKIVQNNDTATGYKSIIGRMIPGSKFHDLMSKAQGVLGAFGVTRAALLRKLFGSTHGQLTERESIWMQGFMSVFDRKMSKQEMLHQLYRAKRFLNKMQLTDKYQMRTIEDEIRFNKMDTSASVRGAYNTARRFIRDYKYDAGEYGMLPVYTPEDIVDRQYTGKYIDESDYIDYLVTGNPIRSIRSANIRSRR